jgi:hypothetical protein
MRKLVAVLGIVALLFVATGCAHSAAFSAGKANAGYYTRAHAWEEPHFTADLESNPVKSELGMGFVTVGSHAGWGDHPEGKWVSIGADLGPDK